MTIEIIEQNIYNFIMAKPLRGQPKLMYLQEDMNLMTEFDLKIFQFMSISQKHDVTKQLQSWYKTM